MSLPQRNRSSDKIVAMRTNAETTMSTNPMDAAPTSPDPTAPDVAGLFQKAGVTPDRTKQILARPQEDVVALARHAAKIV